MLRDLWDPELLGLDREMHYHLRFMRLRCLRCGYRFVRGCVVLLLVLDTRSGRVVKLVLARQVNCPARADLYGFADMLDAAPGRQTSRELGYGITDTWDDLVGAIQEIAPTTLEGVNQRVIELATTIDEEDEIIYSQLDDARYDRALLRARVNRLDSDRPFHRCTALLMDEEARLSRAAWARSMDACDQTNRRQSTISKSTKDSEEPQELPDDRGFKHSRDLLRSCRARATRRKAAQEPQVEASHRNSPNSHRLLTTTTSVTSAQLQAMIDEGVTAVLAARATTRNGDDSHTSGTGREGMNALFGTLQQRFQELALLSDRMFPEETDKIERYVGGMPDLIYSSVVASKPKTMQEAIEMATDLMDRRINTLAERQTENKRKFEDAPRNNQNQQPNKRQNTGRAYAAGNGDKKSYEGTKPLCPKCNFNHYGPCIPKCTNCKKLGHLAKDCRSRSATANNNNNRNNNNNNNPRAQGANTNAIICFECGAPGHFRKNCP
ncbi:putative reverse transcriptase domain-containing protein [Tanacetum coccineum]